MGANSFANSVVKINQNLQSGSTDYSHLGIAKTLIHELIHAVLNTETFDKGGLNATQTAMSNPAAFPTYNALIVASGGDLNRADHEYIALYKIDLLADLLAKYDDNRLSADDYKALSWDGLENTERYSGTGPNSSGHSDRYMDLNREQKAKSVVNARKSEDPCNR